MNREGSDRPPAAGFVACPDYRDRAAGSVHGRDAVGVEPQARSAASPSAARWAGVICRV